VRVEPATGLHDLGLVGDLEAEQFTEFQQVRLDQPEGQLCGFAQMVAGTVHHDACTGVHARPQDLSKPVRVQAGGTRTREHQETISLGQVSQLGCQSLDIILGHSRPNITHVRFTVTDRVDDGDVLTRGSRDRSKADSHTCCAQGVLEQRQRFVSHPTGRGARRPEGGHGS